jgi:nucleoside-diphosphate-sugar epimerase
LSDKRIVLIGGSGFVGSNLRKFLSVPLVVPDENEADLTNIDSLRSVIQHDDIIINSAGYANATDTSKRGKALFEVVNVTGVRNLAEVAVEKGAAQLIHISSIAAMGRWHCDNVTEDMLMPVSSPYAESKLLGEKALEDFQDRLPITILRPTSVFGEGRGLARTLCGIVSKGIVPLPGAGTARIPFTYIGNIAQCVELSIAGSNCFGRTFIIGDENSYSLLAIVKGLADALNVTIHVVPIPAMLARLGVNCLESVAKLSGRPPIMDSGRLDTLTNSVSYSIEAFKQATGYKPRYSLDQSLKLIAEWYTGNRD